MEEILRIHRRKNKVGRKPRFADQQLVDIFKLKQQGLSNKEIFVKVANDYNLTITKSYLTKAAGHFYRLRQQAKRRIRNGDDGLLIYLQENGIWTI